MASVNKLVLPYLDEMTGTKMSSKSRMYLSILKSNLEELLTPLTRKLSSEYLNLTLTEIKVADLVRRGLTSKDIAVQMNISPNAVLFHRKNIRKKLGIAKKKTNLGSYLQTLSA